MDIETTLNKCYCCFVYVGSLNWKLFANKFANLKSDSAVFTSPSGQKQQP